MTNKRYSIDWYNVHTDDFICFSIMLLDGSDLGVIEDFHCLRGDELKVYVQTELDKLPNLRKTDLKRIFKKGKQIYGLSEEESIRRDRLYWGNRLKYMGKTDRKIRAKLLKRLGL